MARLTLLDTDIVFDYFVGGESAVTTERLLHRTEVVLSPITVYEIFAGVLSEQHLRQREVFLELCDLVELTASMARTAARLYSELKIHGSLIPNEDLLIAATALETGYPLLTKNRLHFERIPGLILL